MVFVSRLVSDIELLAIVRDWLDALAREDYEAVFAALGYAVANGRPGADCIREEIKRYRSPEYFPDVDEFAVTDWRVAQGGNPEPLQLIRWYEPNELTIRATVEVHLPLNGRWSDLEADFLLLEKGFEDGYLLRLEHIWFPSR